jgi:hypothetical protein
LLPVKKPKTDFFRPDQDFHAVNSATINLHPVVPNPYKLLDLIPAETKFCTCVELKDAYFCPPGPTEPTHLFLPMGKS